MMNTVGDKVLTITDVIGNADVSREIKELLWSLTKWLSLNIESVEKIIKIIKDQGLESSLRLKSIELYSNDSNSIQFKIELNNILQFIYSSECASQAVDDFAESFIKTLVNENQ